MRTVFKINILTWEKHNGDKKKHFRYFMVENRFFEDSKISQLKQIEVLFYLKCLCIAGDLTSSSIEIHAGLMPNRWRIGDKLMEDCCNSLQEIQLLTYEKTPLNRREMKGKEKNTCSEALAVAENPLPAKPKSSPRKTFSINNLNELESSIPNESKQIWSQLYPDVDFLNREALKAINWLAANPSKNKKSQRGWIQFLSNWFERGWPNYQKNIATNRPDTLAQDVAELFKKQGLNNA